MKSIFTGLVIAIVMAGFAANADAARIYRHYMKVKFEVGTGEEFAQNTMDDGIVIPDDYDSLAFGISFVLFPGEKFKITTQAESGGDGTPECKYSEPRIKEIRRGRRLVWVDVNPSVSTDDGSTCNYTIKLDNGKEATVQYYETGT